MMHMVFESRNLPMKVFCYFVTSIKVMSAGKARKMYSDSGKLPINSLKLRASSTFQRRKSVKIAQAQADQLRMA